MLKLKSLNIATKLKWLRNAGFMFILLVLAIILFNIKMLSAIRGSVAAQGIWEKHQKLVHTHLSNYVYSGSEKDFELFQNTFTTIDTYEKLRQEFLKGAPDYDKSYELLIQGGNHPDDIPGMFFLFKHFMFISYINDAFNYWGSTQPLFVKQNAIANQIKEASLKGETVDESTVIPEINAINEELSSLGANFAWVLGEGSRWMESLVFYGIMLFVVLIGFSMLFIFHKLSAQITRWIDKLGKGAKAVSKGDLNYRIEVSESHELANLSSEFNQMTNAISDLISQNKSIEGHLRDLSLVASETDNAIFIANAKGEIEWVNQAFTKISGYTFEEVVNTNGEIVMGETILTGLSPSSPHFIEMLQTKSSVRYESENFTKNGDKYWVVTTLSPVYDESGELLKVIAIDVDFTKMKQTEQALSLAKEKAEESEQAKQLFLANMSHEIRTPMNAIVGFTDLLEQTVLDPNQKESVTAIKSSGKILLVLINDILDLAKIEAGQITLENISFDIREILHQACSLFSPKAQTKNLSCALNIHNEIPNRLIGDPYRINQIIINLLSNAIKFTEKGLVKLELSVAELDQDNIQILMEVTDTGIGIKADNIDLIFESFTQASDGTTRKFGGTGLGLSIVKYLVDMMEGEITVQSEIGKGTSFKVTIPLKVDNSIAADEIVDIVDVVETGQYNLVEASNTKLLLVEDNPVNQLLATRVLSGFGYQVDVAENGQVALNKLNKHSYNLVLMDLQMPVMDGFQTTRSIRSSGSKYTNIPIIAMTAHVLQGEKEKCVNVGMDDYISKPFSAKELDSLIKRHLSLI